MERRGGGCLAVAWGLSLLAWMFESDGYGGVVGEVGVMVTVAWGRELTSLKLSALSRGGGVTGGEDRVCVSACMCLCESVGEYA